MTHSIAGRLSGALHFTKHLLCIAGVDKSQTTSRQHTIGSVDSLVQSSLAPTVQAVAWLDFWTHMSLARSLIPFDFFKKKINCKNPTSQMCFSIKK
jgi:hypothetical protein